MDTINHLLGLEEQICYVQCSFCTTILLVSVPLTSLSTIVTVKCGHCSGLLSVNMFKSYSYNFPNMNLFAALNQNAEQEAAQGSAPKAMDTWSTTVASSDHDREVDEEKDDDVDNENDDDDDDVCMSDHVVHKPPQKKKRAPSAYNCFIKDEIRRLKAMNPSMTHKEAFSTAAKNWAHFPSSVEGDDDDDDDDKNVQKKVKAEVSGEMKISV